MKTLTSNLIKSLTHKPTAMQVAKTELEQKRCELLAAQSRLETAQAELEFARTEVTYLTKHVNRLKSIETLGAIELIARQE